MGGAMVPHQFGEPMKMMSCYSKKILENRIPDPIIFIYFLIGVLSRFQDSFTYITTCQFRAGGNPQHP